MDGWLWNVAWLYGMYTVSGPSILGQIAHSTRVYSHKTRAMARSRRRLDSESSSDEKLPNAWEDMKKRLEPVSPVPSEEPPEVIEIVDDTTPSKGGSPLSELLIVLWRRSQHQDHRQHHDQSRLSPGHLAVNIRLMMTMTWMRCCMFCCRLL